MKQNYDNKIKIIEVDRNQITKEDEFAYLPTKISCELRECIVNFYNEIEELTESEQMTHHSETTQTKEQYVFRNLFVDWFHGFDSEEYPKRLFMIQDSSGCDLIGYFITTKENGTGLYIEEIYIKPKFRKKNYCYETLRKIIYRDTGCNLVYSFLEFQTSSKNVGAISAFTNIFNRLEKEDFVINNEEKKFNIIDTKDGTITFQVIC